MSVGLAERLKSLGHIASLVNSGSALPEILERIVTAVCQRSAWSSSAIMAIDEAKGFSVLVARYDPLFVGKSGAVERWELATSPTRSALESGRPIVIEDARTATKFAGYRREAIERDYRTVVLLPFSATDEQGRGMVMSVHAHQVRKVDADELVFLETIAHLASLAVEKAHKLRLEAQQSERLRQALEIHNLAMEQVLASESLDDFAALCRRCLDRPFAIADLTANQLFVSGSPLPDRLPEAAWRARLQRESLRAIADLVRAASAGHFQTPRQAVLAAAEPPIACEAVVEPCMAAGSVLGGFILFTDGRPLDPSEALTAEELRAALAVLLLRRQIRFEAQAETHGEFFSRLFSGNWRDAAATLGRAHHLGLPLEEPARLAAMVVPGLGPAVPAKAGVADIERALARLAQQRAAGATAFFDADSFVVFLPERKGGAKAAQALLAQMLEEVQWLAQSKPVACLSRLCTKLDDYRETRKDCARVLELAERVGRVGIVASGDFGPLARLIAVADPDALRRFVEETIGRIEARDRRSGGDGSLLATLDAFLACGGRYQAAAERLGIHVTTLRYRLKRVTELFDLDLENPETRVALEVALRVRSALSLPAAKP